MAIQTTRWSPDTCGCAVEYNWDDSVPADSRVHTLARFIQKCSRHNPFADAIVWAALTDENPRKNILRGLAVTNFSALTQTYTDQNGNSWVDFKPGISFSFSFDVNHILHITITGLTVQQKTTLQNLADNRFGAGKVVID